MTRTARADIDTRTLLSAFGSFNANHRFDVYSLTRNEAGRLRDSEVPSDESIKRDGRGDEGRLDAEEAEKIECANVKHFRNSDVVALLLEASNELLVR